MVEQEELKVLKSTSRPLRGSFVGLSLCSSTGLPFHAKQSPTSQRAHCEVDALETHRGEGDRNHRGGKRRFGSLQRGKKNQIREVLLGERLVVTLPGQRYDAVSGLNHNGFRDYESAGGRYVQSDAIGLNGGVSTYSYVNSSPINLVDPTGLDWIEYTGKHLVLYGGELGDRGSVVRYCKASSGGYDDLTGNDYRLSGAQIYRGWGPTPGGKYQIDLRPDPNRIARVQGGYLVTNKNLGIERIPNYGNAQSLWGTWRARLFPYPSTNYHGRDPVFYIHDSKKGETSGCIETCSRLLQNLIQLRSAGISHVDVNVIYNGNVSTHGGP